MKCECEGSYVCLSCEQRKLWDSLNSEEKLTAVAYKRILKSGKIANQSIVERVNQIYARYPEFDVRVIP
jgi:hypothetical protein